MRLPQQASGDLTVNRGGVAVSHDRLCRSPESFLGDGKVKQLEPRLTSEDFSHYSHQIPAIFYRLGVGEVPGVHNSQFDVDESAIKIASGLMAFLAMKM